MPTLLTDAGCTVDAWETTYIHELSGENPVLEWITGTALTPVKSRLTDEQWQQFRAGVDPAARRGLSARDRTVGHSSHSAGSSLSLR